MKIDAKSIGRRAFIILSVAAILMAGCDVWWGDEVVYVKLGAETISVPLQGLPTSEVKGRTVVRLSVVVEEAVLIESPEKYFYNLIASDGYSLRALLINEKRDTGLPPWQDIQRGYLYASESYELMVGWEANTIGADNGGCYNVKYMSGGTIEALEEDVAVND